jgi:hypothetical protein
MWIAMMKIPEARVFLVVSLALRCDCWPHPLAEAPVILFDSAISVPLWLLC